MIKSPMVGEVVWTIAGTVNYADPHTYHEPVAVEISRIEADGHITAHRFDPETGVLDHTSEATTIVGTNQLYDNELDAWALYLHRIQDDIDRLAAARTRAIHRMSELAMAQALARTS